MEFKADLPKSLIGKVRAASSSDWRELARLGEQLLGATSLAAQRDCITAVSARLLGADAEVWLDEKLLRLPNATEPPLFSPEPASQAMSRVLKAHGLTVKQKKGLKKKGGSRSAWAGIPFIDHGTTLGALLLTRSNGPDFKKDELSLLEAIAGIGVVSMVASHRVAVERFRLDQLNLVREVSAQIANVLDLDELAKRVTELIQQTFQFYYVAILHCASGRPQCAFVPARCPYTQRVNGMKIAQAIIETAKKVPVIQVLESRKSSMTKARPTPAKEKKNVPANVFRQ